MNAETGGHGEKASRQQKLNDTAAGKPRSAENMLARVSANDMNPGLPKTLRFVESSAQRDQETARTGSIPKCAGLRSISRAVRKRFVCRECR